MLEEPLRHVLVRFIMSRQLDRDLQHVKTEERHPGCPVRLLEVTAGRQRRTTVKNADVIQAQEAAFECIFPGTIFAVEPPGEVEQKLLKASLQPHHISLSRSRLFQTIGED